MDVTTNYNAANIAAVQDRPTRSYNNNAAGVTERPPVARPNAAEQARPNAAVNNQRPQPTDTNYANGASLREENITEAMLERAFSDANSVLVGSSFRLAYTTHEDTGRIMVTVLERESDEVLREIPSESRLDIYARVTEFVGLLFDQGN